MNTPFLLNSQPFFILGGQVHNSSGYSPETMQTAWKALEVLHANTAEIPVYWEQIEPVEGQFDFNHLDGILQAARQRNLKLVLLWFGTWKNGSMQYVPEWVKNNPGRFPRVQTPGGTQTWVLSSHASETYQADQSAFCRLLAYLHATDGAARTVIGIQIENEPGILGSVRDYAPLAQVEFDKEIPTDLAQSLERLEDGPVGQAWRGCGALKNGSWTQVFGGMAAEVFTTWSIARYIDRLAEAGKAVYDLPMYVNVWLGENGWQLPGVSYPSGGPVSFVLDLWKIATPHIDLIAPDIYIEAQAEYNKVCDAYSRKDNPLFIPESGPNLSNALNLFEAVARYGAVGYAVFGIESILQPDGNVKPEAHALAESFHILQAMLPLVTQFHGTGKLQAVIQREFMREQLLDLGQYLGIARFANLESRVFRDFHHNIHDPAVSRGRGLVVMPAPNEIFLAGADFRLMLKTRQADERRLFAQANEQFDGPLTRYLRVEEGHFSANGDWVVDRIRNGDEITSGLWVTAECGVVHAVLVE